jgi:hypothetical protein
MVRTRAAKPHDWDPAKPSPGRLIERSVERTMRAINRRLADTLPVHAFIRPWSEMLDELFVENFEGENRWVLGVTIDETHRLRVGPLCEALGEPATAVVLAGLMQHTPLNTEGPNDLEWIIDGWYDAASAEEPEAAEILARAESATQLSERINTLLGNGYNATHRTLPPGRIRRLLGKLQELSTSTPRANNTAWRETEGADWGLPLPALQLVWDHGCALDHAVDEAEFVNGQDGSFPTPQQMWILDPRDPVDAACTWSRWVHALTQISVTTRLLQRLDTVIDSFHSSR